MFISVVMTFSMSSSRWDEKESCFLFLLAHKILLHHIKAVQIRVVTFKMPHLGPPWLLGVLGGSCRAARLGDPKSHLFLALWAGFAHDFSGALVTEHQPSPDSHIFTKCFRNPQQSKVLQPWRCGNFSDISLKNPALLL